MSYSPSTPHSQSHSHGSWLGTLLDLDAEIHGGVLEEATAVAAAYVGDTSAVRRVLDIGAGTGSGSFALANHFPHANVVAVDIDELMLAKVRDRAQVQGVSDRITTVAADVSAEAPPLGSADLIWSSSALHEVKNSARAFQNLFDALVPGGLLVAMEMDAPPHLLPARFEAFEERLRTAGGSSPATEHPHWADAIESAGFIMLETRQLQTDQTLPANGPAGEYATLELRRIGHHAAPSLDKFDRTTLFALAGEGPDSVRSLGDLWVRGTRTLWAARRP